MSLKQNIMNIYFKGKHLITSKAQYQYNHGQFLYFADLNLPEVFEVHFSNKDKGESKTQIGRDKLVQIPDEYFWSGALMIYVWIYLHSIATDGETVYEVRIPLTKRAKPTDEELEPEQQTVIDRAIAELNNAVNVTTENANQTSSDRTQVANIKEDIIDLKEEIDGTATIIANTKTDIEQIAETVDENAQSAHQSMESANEASESAARSASEASQSAGDASQSADSASQSASEASQSASSASQSASNASQSEQNASQSESNASESAEQAEEYKDQAEQFKNQSEINVTHYPKIVDEYWYVWDASQNDFVNTGVDAKGDDAVVVFASTTNAILACNDIEATKQRQILSFEVFAYKGTTRIPIDDILNTNVLRYNGGYITPTIGSNRVYGKTEVVYNVPSGTQIVSDVTNTSFDVKVGDELYNIRCSVVCVKDGSSSYNVLQSNNLIIIECDEEGKTVKTYGSSIRIDVQRGGLGVKINELLYTKSMYYIEQQTETSIITVPISPTIVIPSSTVQTQATISWNVPTGVKMQYTSYDLSCYARTSGSSYYIPITAICIKKGKDGNSGVYIGEEEPTDEDVNVWIDSDGTPDGISDVQVNGASVVTNGIANIPEIPSALKYIKDDVSDNGGIIEGSVSGDWSNVATGYASHAEGGKTSATGNYAHSEGNQTKATGNYSHAEGGFTNATGLSAHSEGGNNIASGDYSHAEGNTTVAEKEKSHAEGSGTTASGIASHAEGGSTEASGDFSHTEGTSSKASDYSAHAEGSETKATGNASHAEGFSTEASGDYSHAEGRSSIANSSSAHAEGNTTTASAAYSHAEGNNTVANGSSSHAEGVNSKALGQGSHAEGYTAIANSDSSHAEGNNTTATGLGSHVEGNKTKTNNMYAHAEGNNTTAEGISSHTEGEGTKATKIGSHAEGGGSQSTGNYSHSEGSGTTASGQSSHAEGGGTNAQGNQSHAEGGGTQAIGNVSHAEGDNTTSIGYASHAEGHCTTAQHKSQHVFGEYNIVDPSRNESSTRGNYVEIVGNGTAGNALSNARTLDWDGNEKLAGSLTLGMNTQDETSLSASELKTLKAIKPVDSTLTVEGAPADAKIVGDELTGVKRDLNDKAPVIIETVSGSIASFADGADDMPMKSLIVNIEPVQSGSGDPSPDNVRPISGWTGCEVAVSPTTDAQDGTTYPISWQSEAGTVYGGTLDVVSGLLTVDMAIVDLGTLTWSVPISANPNCFTCRDLTALIAGRNAICSNYVVSGGSTQSSAINDAPDKTVMINKGIGTTGNYPNGTVIVKDSAYASATGTEFENAMNGVQFCYELAEPIVYHLDPTEVKSILGQNHVWADCGDVEVEYRADTKLYIEKLTQPEEDDMIADSAITSGQFFMVGNSLYRALANIASGATITVGTNAQRVSLSDALNLINS